MESKATPSLWHLLGAYLNQDWFDFYPDEDSAVDSFIAESGDLVPALPGEIDWVLATFQDPVALEEYLDSLGCEYVPSAGVTTYREWLTQIADRVRKATA